ncbi:hypothetical protein Tco_0022932, partial [Tanacetum coccineum]
SRAIIPGKRSVRIYQCLMVGRALNFLEVGRALNFQSVSQTQKLSIILNIGINGLYYFGIHSSIILNSILNFLEVGEDFVDPFNMLSSVLMWDPFKIP